MTRAVLAVLALAALATAALATAAAAEEEGRGDCWWVKAEEPLATATLRQPSSRMCGACEFASVRFSPSVRADHTGGRAAVLAAGAIVPRALLKVACSAAERPRYQEHRPNRIPKWVEYSSPVTLHDDTQGVTVACDKPPSMCNNTVTLHIFDRFEPHKYEERKRAAHRFGVARHQLIEESERMESGNPLEFLFERPTARWTPQPLTAYASGAAPPRPPSAASAPDMDALPNLLVIILDSASRAHSLRRIPGALALLDEWDRDASSGVRAFDFERLNVVGINSPPNFIGFLTGSPHADVAHTESWLWPIVRFFTGDRQNISPFRVKIEEAGAFLWSKLHKAGYTTFYTEGVCFDKTTRVMGFTPNIKELYDFEVFGWRPFFYPDTAPPGIDDYVQAPWCALDNKIAHFYDGFRTTPHYPRCVCLGQKYAHEHELRLIRQFFANYDGLPRFAMSVFQEPHDRKMQIFGSMDEGLKDFLHSLRDASSADEFEDDGYPRGEERRAVLEDTIVVIMGDHGLNFGDHALGTTQGWLEHKNPLFRMIVPQSYLDVYPQLAQNLERNQKRLITPYDLFATFVNVPHYPLSAPVPNPHMSLSLFTPIPENRTCDDAHIPREYCHDLLAQRIGCWTDGFACELPAENDRTAFVSNLLNTSASYQHETDPALLAHWARTTTIPRAEVIHSLRTRQRLYDISALLVVSALIFVLARRFAAPLQAADERKVKDAI